MFGISTLWGRKYPELKSRSSNSSLSSAASVSLPADPLTQREAEIKDLVHNLAVLQEETQTKDDELKRLRRDLELAQQLQAELKTQWEDERSSLRREADNLRAMYHSSKALLDSNALQLVDAREDNLGLQRRLKELREEVSLVRNEMEQLQSKHNEAISLLSLRNSEVSDLTSKASSLHDENGLLQSRLEESATQLLVRATELKQATDELTALREEDGHLRSNLNQAMDALENRTKALDDATTERSSLAAESYRLQFKLTGTDAMLVKQTKALEEALEQTSSLRCTNERLHTALAETTQRLTYSVSESHALRTEATLLREEAEAMKLLYAQTIALYDSHSSEIENQNKALLDELENQLEQMSVVQSEAQRCRSAHDRATTLLSSRMSEIEELRATTSSLREELSRLQSLYDEAIQREANYASQCEQLVKDNGLSQERLKDLQAQQDDVTALLSGCTITLKDVEEDRELLQSELALRIEQVNSLKADYDTLLSEYDHATSQLHAEVKRQEEEIDVLQNEATFWRVKYDQCVALRANRRDSLRPLANRK
ncbi:hypothetical protein AX16_003638 [Volvariella volvacea WC 439]|nr:hypothetical protein AX16_003638 [Volvariella volvacea WC 439]